MNLFDLHCDTATGLYFRKQDLYNNELHISLKNAEYLKSYAQVMAVWTLRSLSDAEGYARFFEVANYLQSQIDIYGDKVALIRNADELLNASKCQKVPMILSVEDARILENDISRLNAIYNYGVRLLTLNWYGDTCIGGAHNTHNGLSKFGIDVVNTCFDIGIIPDISHSSFEGAETVLNIAREREKPVVASHSDSYSVNAHTRNLRDNDFLVIKKLGGIVGINLCPEHLSSNKDAALCDIIKHIEYYLSLGGENTVAIGGDLDGTDLPNGFSGISDIYKIANELQRLNYSDELIEKITYKNAFEFFKNNL